MVRDVVGIAAGRTKAPTPISSPTVESSKNLEEASHLHVSVYDFVGIEISSCGFQLKTKISTDTNIIFHCQIQLL